MRKLRRNSLFVEKETIVQIRDEVTEECKAITGIEVGPGPGAQVRLEKTIQDQVTIVKFGSLLTFVIMTTEIRNINKS